MTKNPEVSSNTPKSPETQHVIESAKAGEDALKEHITTVTGTKSELSGFDKFFGKLKNAWNEVKEGNISKAIDTLFGDSQQESQQTSSTASTTEKAKVSNGKSYEIDHFNISVSPETKKLWENLKGKEKPDLEPFACAMKAYETEKAKGHLKNTTYVTVVDFTKNQLTNNRFFVINLDTNTVEYAEKCGHGRKSGDKNRATSFSNIKGSNQSSLGAYITKDHSDQSSKKWHGNFPQGQEKSNNASRGIAIHPVKSLIFSNSGKPTSEGCFTIPASQDYVDEILGKIEGKSLVFSYAKSKNYFAQSNYFQQDSSGRYAA